MERPMTRLPKILGILAAALILPFLLQACSASPSAGTYAPEVGAAYSQVGMASWYGGKFHGRQTASGQRYDMHAMTAAHKSLPFGTRVRVTNLANKRSVVLTINDRGPFVRGRIVDVSMRAAEVLRFKHQGTARVRLEVL